MKRAVLLGAIALLVLAFKMLPWWAGVALVVGLGLAAKYLLVGVFKNFAMRMLTAKSVVLAGAGIQLHHVEAALAPKFDETFEEDDDERLEREALQYRYLDVSVDVPNASESCVLRESDEDEEDEEKVPACGFSHWEPGELMVVRADATPGFSEEEDSVGELFGVEIREGDAWVSFDGKVVGSQRLRLHVGFQPGTKQFRFRYYAEILKQLPA